MSIRSQGPRAKEHTSKKNSFILLATILICALAVSGLAEAQTRSCNCTFDTREYEAYGTGGACGIFMYNKSHACEVSFSGVGANTSVLREHLGEQAVREQLALAPQIFDWYVSYDKQGDKKELNLQPDFIERSLVVLVRASLFRQSNVDAKVPLKEIDGNVVKFAKEYSKRIAATFAGKAPAFDGPWGDNGKFIVGRGYVEMYFQSGVIRAVYFSGKPR